MLEPVPGPTPWTIAIGLSKVGAILMPELEKCLYIEFNLCTELVRPVELKRDVTVAALATVRSIDAPTLLLQVEKQH